MPTTETGKHAEAVVAAFLEAKGFTVMAKNWRTKWCEIDIIATKENTVYFVEVKYRKSTAWGAGLDYITPKKMQQMQFAAQFWIARHGEANNYRLAAAEVGGSNFTVREWIEDILS